MIPVAEAITRITGAFEPLAGETVWLGEAVGRIPVLVAIHVKTQSDLSLARMPSLFPRVPVHRDDFPGLWCGEGNEHKIESIRRCG